MFKKKSKNPKPLTSKSLLLSATLHKQTMAHLTFFITFLLIITVNSSLTQEAETLLKIKNTHLTDPTGFLSDWLPSNKSPCNWTGIYCNSKTHSITSIDFTGFGISGHFPSGFCQISSLQNLTLSDNFFGGYISDQEISSCSHLHYLNLTLNLFVGSLPEFKPGFSNLSVLDLSYNNFTGNIPPSFGQFPKLQVLSLAANLLNGTIPLFLTNLTELISIDVTWNPFAPGPLPLEIGNLNNLKYLRISYTNVIGSIPESIGKLIALKSLDLSHNYLTGSIPESIGGLMSIEQIELFNNRISGELPESLGNLTTLINFDASENKLTGKLPEKFAGLNLFSLGLNENNLEGEIPVSLALNTRLYELKLFKNNFTGTIPRDLGRNSDLTFIDVSDNQLEGTIPSFLCYRKKFRSIDAFNNRFSGKFPEIYGDCKTIDYIRIFNNEFSGEFPIGLWSLPKLTIFEIRNNRFEGSIPSSIAISMNITELLISGNNFSGVFPLEMCQLHKLVVIDARRNQFSGELPTCITEMKQLQTLDLQDNKFSGEIPSNAGSWTDLTELGLSRNRFSGEIPSGLGDLPVLTYLDLSNNLLSGKIPMKLTNLKLNQLNLSNNYLSGPIPPGFATSFYLQGLLGNPGLCSSNLKPFPPCSEPKTISWFLVVVCLFLSLLLLFSVFWLFKSKCKSIRRKSKPLWKFTSFHMLSFKEEEIFSSLTEENLIGTGGSGKVYRARLKNGQTVAVKKLWECDGKLEMGNVFRSEVETLGSIRHGNIVKLLFVCTSEDFRVLVYDYMENGSLGDVLHGEKGGALLDWSNRFNIAVGTAQGLAYLHHDCVPSIVHRDVKSNNILLDVEFRARVADFGIAKTLMRPESDQDENLMSRIAGSYGYIAPEYAYTMKVTEKSDVYSFGVVLMELVTGKRPIDPSFGESKDIVRWVTDAASTSQEEKTDQNTVSSTTTTTTTNLRHIVDLRLMKTSSEGDYEEMEKVLNVALLCTSKFPLNRPSMRRVVELLKDCKKNVHAITAGKV